MEEKILLNRKHGMAALLITLILYLAAVAGCVFGGIILGDNGNAALLVISIIWLCIGWIPFCGLKILEPQEALVLTLFGKYVGTLKGDGYYFVNPF